MDNTKLDEYRAWLAANFAAGMARLTDAEAYAVVAVSPVIKPPITAAPKEGE